MFKATQVQLCVSRLMMPAAEIITAISGHTAQVVGICMVLEQSLVEVCLKGLNSNVSSCVGMVYECM